MNVTRIFAILAVVAILVLSFGMSSPVKATEPDVELLDVTFEGGFVNKVSLMEDGTGKVIVDYTKFIITTDTDIDEGHGMFAPYVFVDVEAVRHHGMLFATKITVLAEDPGEVKFDGGKICVIDLMAYKVIVNGTTFITTADTVIDEGLMVGDLVKVEADRIDGKLIATKITLLD
ncbi:MAG: hypothetical protein HY665_06640 [Chloroflexi bacterium]|nr:hypothetical protein [Chloroflexota bacterium]